MTLWSSIYYLLLKQRWVPTASSGSNAHKAPRTVQHNVHRNRVLPSASSTPAPVGERFGIGHRTSWVASQGGRETFTFFVTDTNNAKAFLALRLLYRPLRPWSQLPHRATTLQTNNTPASSRSGDVVIGEGFVDLLGMFPVQHGTYTPGGLKGNSRRVAVPMREPIEKR